jgi:hypothetical protein
VDSGKLTITGIQKFPIRALTTQIVMLMPPNLYLLVAITGHHGQHTITVLTVHTCLKQRTLVVAVAAAAVAAAAAAAAAVSAVSKMVVATAVHPNVALVVDLVYPVSTVVVAEHARHDVVAVTFTM